MLGVDGSQIFPDRHALVLYYLLQVGAMVFRYNGAAPTVHTTETLRYEDRDLFDAHGYLIGGEMLAMERMLREMEVLADLVSVERPAASGCIFGLSDGPLLWPYLDRDNVANQACASYLEALARVQRANGIPVGYIDRPGGHPLLDLLWASRLDPEELPQRIEETPLGRLTDEQLLLQVLAPGERSAWFTRRTPTNQHHAAAGQEIWFCYMDLGSTGDRTIARIEVPAWAADHVEAMAALHAALRHQTAALDGYPYVLARAHEEAVVTTQDKAALEQAIQRQLLGLGIVALPSNKARQKSLLGKR
ncbi:MAG: DNA double-strand break repair nuclease NurA [Anaerolineae bacterium]